MIDRAQLQKDLIRLIKGKEERSETNYLPIGAYITAYSRENIINAAISCGNTFVYCDTDSLHLVGDDIPDIDIHPSRIGAWKLENTFNRARFLHAKCYIEEMDTGKCKVTCAGLPESCKGQVNFSNFKIGAEYTGKLQQRSVAGGCYLEETTFKIGDK